MDSSPQEYREEYPYSSEEDEDNQHKDDHPDITADSDLPEEELDSAEGDEDDHCLDEHPDVTGESILHEEDQSIRNGIQPETETPQSSDSSQDDLEPPSIPADDDYSSRIRELENNLLDLKEKLWQEREQFRRELATTAGERNGCQRRIDLLEEELRENASKQADLAERLKLEEGKVLAWTERLKETEGIERQFREDLQSLQEPRQEAGEKEEHSFTEEELERELFGDTQEKVAESSSHGETTDLQARLDAATRELEDKSAEVEYLRAELMTAYIELDTTRDRSKLPTTPASVGDGTFPFEFSPIEDSPTFSVDLSIEDDDSDTQHILTTPHHDGFTPQSETHENNGNNEEFTTYYSLPGMNLNLQAVLDATEEESEYNAEVTTDENLYSSSPTLYEDRSSYVAEQNDEDDEYESRKNDNTRNHQVNNNVQLATMQMALEAAQQELAQMRALLPPATQRQKRPGTRHLVLQTGSKLPEQTRKALESNRDSIYSEPYVSPSEKKLIATKEEWDTLKADLDSCRRENEHIKQHIGRLSHPESNHLLREEITSLEATKVALAKDVDKLSGLNEILAAQLESKIREHQTALSSLKKAKQTITSLEALLSHADADLDITESGLKSTNEEIQSWKRETAKLKQDLSAMDLKLKAKDQELNSAKADQGKAEKMAGEAVKTHMAAQSEIQELKDDVEVMHDELKYSEKHFKECDRVRKDFADVNKEKENFEKETFQLRDKVRDLAKEVQMKTELFEDAEMRRVEAAKERDELRKSLQNVQGGVEIINAKHKETESSKQELIENALAIRDQESKNVRQLGKRVAEADKQSQVLIKKIEDLETNKSFLEVETKNLRASLVEMRMELNSRDKMWSSAPIAQMSSHSMAQNQEEIVSPITPIALQPEPTTPPHKILQSLTQPPPPPIKPPSKIPSQFPKAPPQPNLLAAKAPKSNPREEQPTPIANPEPKAASKPKAQPKAKPKPIPTQNLRRSTRLSHVPAPVYTEPITPATPNTPAAPPISPIKLVKSPPRAEQSQITPGLFVTPKSPDTSHEDSLGAVSRGVRGSNTNVDEDERDQQEKDTKKREWEDISMPIPSPDGLNTPLQQVTQAPITPPSSTKKKKVVKEFIAEFEQEAAQDIEEFDKEVTVAKTNNMNSESETGPSLDSPLTPHLPDSPKTPPSFKKKLQGPENTTTKPKKAARKRKQQDLNYKPSSEAPEIESPLTPDYLLTPAQVAEELTDRKAKRVKKNADLNFTPGRELDEPESPILSRTPKVNLRKEGLRSGNNEVDMVGGTGVDLGEGRKTRNGKKVTFVEGDVDMGRELVGGEKHTQT